MPDAPRVLIITPTYNERDNVPVLLDALRVHAPDAHVLVVDDNSPDGTGDLVEELARQRPNLYALHRPAKQGLGSAYKAGFAWALERGYDRIVQMDADLSHPPASVPALIAATAPASSDGAAACNSGGGGGAIGNSGGGYDFAVGSRYIPGGGVAGWPLRRKIISRSANFYARTMLRVPVRDLTAGFKCWRADVLRSLDLPSLQASGYVFLVETTWRSLNMGYRVKEIPIIFREREKGASKMGLHVAREGLLQVLKWSVSRGPRPRPRNCPR